MTIGFMVTSLTMALVPRFAQFGQAASSRKSIGVPNFHLRMEAIEFLDLQCSKTVLGPFPRSVPQHNPVSVLYGQFHRTHGLVFALTCTVNCGIFYRQVCVPFQIHVQSIEFTTGGLQISCGKISRMRNGNRMHLNSISSLIAQGLNTKCK